MRKIITSAILGAAATLTAGQVMADPVDAKTAKKLLFSGSGMVLERVETPLLSDERAAEADLLVESMGASKSLKLLISSGYGYYGAVAIAPDQPVELEKLAFTNHLHSPEAASAAALAACTEITGSAECVVVALLLPKKYEPADLSLSYEATERFLDTWRKGDGPKYLAYSTATNAWVIAKGPGADSVALQRCNEKAAAAGALSGDCAIAIAEN